jgi:hypothetical protein
VAKTEDVDKDMIALQTAKVGGKGKIAAIYLYKESGV